MDAATWLVEDASVAGLAETIVAIAPVVSRRLLTRVESTDGATDVVDEFGLACGGRFPSGTGSIGALCLLAATGRIDPWDPSLVFALGFDDGVPVWGAIAGTWFAAERAARDAGQEPGAVVQRICLQIAAALPGRFGGTSTRAA